MFYYVSKVVWFFLTPSNSLVTLVLLGLFLMRTRRVVLGQRMAVVGGVGLLIAGLSPLGNALILPLEERFPAFVDEGTPVAGVIVLGGTFDTEATNVHGQMALNETGERLFALGDLARRYPQARIIYAGGGSEFTPDTTPEATLVENTVASLGVARSRIEFERKSLNTYENALYSKMLAAPKDAERWLVVTSAFHMPRTMGVFAKVGFAVVPYPVDYRTAGNVSLLRPFGFVGEGLRRTDIAAKEWIGLLSYALSGKSDSVFPAP
ncbi:MAG: YdcF family protein [Alphaproteobacteria bacterium]|nr:YdcF family protein [Alphaproteobacteria bacterium]